MTWSPKLVNADMIFVLLDLLCVTTTDLMTFSCLEVPPNLSISKVDSTPLMHCRPWLGMVWVFFFLTFLPGFLLWLFALALMNAFQVSVCHHCGCFTSL